MLYKIKTKNNGLNKRVIALVGAMIVIFLASSYAFYRLKNSSRVVNDTTLEPVSSMKEYINLDPATEEDKAAAEQNKNKIVKNQEEQNNQTSNNKKEVTPVITIARQAEDIVEVRSFVPEVYESSGKCKAIFTKGSEKITREVRGIQDATTTRCDRVVVQRTEFPGGGEWTIVVEYSSPSYFGTSEPRKLVLK